MTSGDRQSFSYETTVSSGYRPTATSETTRATSGSEVKLGMLASVQPAASPPATMNPSTRVGGYVIGTLETPTVAPCWLRTCHIVAAWIEPEWATRGCSCGVLSRKPKTPCRPGFTP